MLQQTPSQQSPLLQTLAQFSPWIATIHNPSTMKNSIVQKKVSFSSILELFT
jgi:hypothetical protein